MVYLYGLIVPPVASVGLRITSVYAAECSIIHNVTAGVDNWTVQRQQENTALDLFYGGSVCSVCVSHYSFNNSATHQLYYNTYYY